MSNKRFFWLKLKEDFFSQKEIKRLRKIAGGDTYTIIYLKLQLLSLKNEGKIYYDGIDCNIYEQLAIEIDEDVENIKVTFLFLEKNLLIDQLDDETFYMTTSKNIMGSETQSAQRIRRYREKQEALHCNAQTLLCNNDVMHAPAQCNKNVTTEIEIEKEIDIDREIKREGVVGGERLKKENSRAKNFVKPSLAEIRDFLSEKNITNVDEEVFYNHYESKGWMVGKNKMKSWRAAVSGWAARASNMQVNAKKGVMDESKVQGSGRVYEEQTSEERIKELWGV